MVKLAVHVTYSTIQKNKSNRANDVLLSLWCAAQFRFTITVKRAKARALF